MKFKIDVDIEDWNPEEDQLKDFIENRIIDSVSEKVTKKIFTDVYINACQKIGDKVDSFIDKALTEFIDRKITVTDKWGDKVEEHENVHEMLKERFDDFMTQRVADNGKATKKGCSYNSNDSRINYIVDKVAEKQIDRFTKDIGRKVDNQLRNLLTKELEENLSSTVFKNIDVKKLLRGF